MKRFSLPLVVGLVVVHLASITVQAQPITRSSFDYNWKFARFGKMPDSSFLSEPGNRVKAGWLLVRAD